MSPDETPDGGRPAAVACTECGTKFHQGQDCEITDGGTFCRPCFNNLTAQIQQAVAQQSENINYPMALVGAVAGGAIGVVAWWGFTVLTQVAFGLVAVVIGIAVAKGAVLFSGNKRSTGLQGLSVVVSVVAFFYASYLVNRSFVHHAFAEEGLPGQLPLLPPVAALIEVISLNFGVMDIVFLAIALYQAWIIPAPAKLAPAS